MRSCHKQHYSPYTYKICFFFKLKHDPASSLCYSQFLLHKVPLLAIQDTGGLGIIQHHQASVGWNCGDLAAINNKQGEMIWKLTHKSQNKNTLETCKNPWPTSGWSKLTKSCTTSTMNFHMAYFSWIPQFGSFTISSEIKLYQSHPESLVNQNEILIQLSC